MFSNQFREVNRREHYSMLEHISRKITEDDSDRRVKPPELEEVGKTVFELNEVVLVNQINFQEPSFRVTRK